MSNKIRSITILFDESTSDEYIDMLEEAFKLYKGIVKVERDVETPETWTTEMKVRRELEKRIWDALYKKD